MRHKTSQFCTVTRHKFPNFAICKHVRSQLRSTYTAEKQKWNQHEEIITSKYSDECFFTQSCNHNTGFNSAYDRFQHRFDQSTKMIFLVQSAVLFLFFCIPYEYKYLGSLGICHLYVGAEYSCITKKQSDMKNFQFCILQNIRENARTRERELLGDTNQEQL